MRNLRIDDVDEVRSLKFIQIYRYMYNHFFGYHFQEPKGYSYAGAYTKARLQMPSLSEVVLCEYGLDITPAESFWREAICVPHMPFCKFT